MGTTLIKETQRFYRAPMLDVFDLLKEIGAMPDDAEIAYTAYAEHQHWQSFQGAGLPTWPHVPQDIKDAWTAAVTAVREAQPQAP